MRSTPPDRGKVDSLDEFLSTINEPFAFDKLPNGDCCSQQIVDADIAHRMGKDTGKNQLPRTWPQWRKVRTLNLTEV